MKRFKKVVTITILVFMGFIIASPSNASSNYKQSKEQYLKEKKAYKESRRQFIEERQKIRTLKGEKNKARYEKSLKNHLEKVIDVLIAKLNRIEAWVNNRKALSSSEKQQIIADINKDKDWMEAKKDGLDGASKEEIKATAKEVREYWRNSKANIKKVIGQVLVNRVELVIEKADGAVVKIETAIDKAKANGKDVTNAEKLLVDLKTKLSSAKEEIEKAKQSFKSISSIKDADNFFKEGKKHLRATHGYLKDVRRIGKLIIADLKK